MLSRLLSPVPWLDYSIYSRALYSIEGHLIFLEIISFVAVAVSPV